MADIKKARSLIKDGDIKFIRLTWCDTANMIRAKAIHARPGSLIVLSRKALVSVQLLRLALACINNDAYNLYR